MTVPEPKTLPEKARRATGFIASVALAILSAVLSNQASGQVIMAITLNTNQSVLSNQTAGQVSAAKANTSQGKEGTQSFENNAMTSPVTLKQAELKPMARAKVSNRYKKGCQSIPSNQAAGQVLAAEKNLKAVGPAAESHQGTGNPPAAALDRAPCEYKR